MPVREKRFIVLDFSDRDEFGFNEHTLPPLIALMDSASPDHRPWCHAGVTGYFLASASAAKRVQKTIEAAEHLRDTDSRFASLGIGSAEGPMIAEFTWLGRLKTQITPIGDVARVACRAANPKS
jgi:hypothetical protein